MNQIVKRHEILRTTFSLEQGQLSQNIASELIIEMPVCDLTHLNKEDCSKKLAQLIKKEAEICFNLMRGPLLKACLFCLSKEEYIVSLCMHHIISDGTSRSILAKEILGFYSHYLKGETVAAFEALPLQYVDFAFWQKKQLEEGKLEAQLNYWLRKLAGIPPRLNITDCINGTLNPEIQNFDENQNNETKTETGVETGSGTENRKHFLIGEDLCRQLKIFCQDQGLTPFMLLLAIFKILLFRYTDQNDIIIGSPITNRKYKELETLIGFFTNTIVFRSHIDGNISFTQFLQEMKQTALEAYSNQDYPYEKLVTALKPERFADQTSIFQILFTYQNTQEDSFNLPNLEVSHFYAEDNGAKFDLSLVVNDKNDRIEFYIEYPADHYHPKVIERMGSHFEELLKSGMSDPACKICHLKLLTEAEQTQLLTDFNQTNLPFPVSASIHQLIEEQALKTPNQIAIVCGNKSISYQDLNIRSNQLAHFLQAQGIQEGALVGVSVVRSLEMIIALLAILKAGAAYVPIDSSYPLARIEVILETTRLKALLTKSHLMSKFESVLQNITSEYEECRIINLDQEIPKLVKYEACNLAPVKSSELAYVIFTSGSTGRPKGVMVEHKNIVNFIYAMDNKLNTAPGTWLAATSISFDISVLELFWTLSRGFKVILLEGDTNYSAESSATSQNDIDFSLFYFASAEEQSDKYRLLLEGAKFADAHGFKAIWSPERHFAKFGGLYPNPSLTNAALAMITKNVALRAGSCVLPLHHPVRVAEEWAFVDNLSGGRVGLSFASGWQPNDFIFAPENFDKRQEIMIDGIQKVRALWRGESVVFKGVAEKPIATQIYPRPVQNELPFWVTSSGNPTTFTKAGELGANLLTHLLGQSLEELSEKIKLYRNAFEKHHPNTKKGMVTLMLHTFVSDDENYVLDQVKEPLKKYLSDSIGLLKPFAESAGKDINNISKEDLDGVLDHAFERYYKTSGLFGTPESCQRFIQQLKAIEIDEIACLIDFGVPSEVVLDNLVHLEALKKNSKPKSGTLLDEIRFLMSKHSVTHFQCTPALASLLVSDVGTNESLQSLQQFLIGGEALSESLASATSKLIKGRVFNMYGPTETTVWSSSEKLISDSCPVTIGKPLANTQMYILDAHGELRPKGIAGEIYIGGEGVSRGYLNQVELTDQKFVKLKIKRNGTERLYKTGDLARYLPKGAIQYIGRNDNQVKIRGFRIELNEIEAVAKKIQGINCAAIVHEDKERGKNIVLYYVNTAIPLEIKVADLDSYLKKSLPHYMIPSQYVKLPSMPLTPNGKIDRIELSKMASSLKSTSKPQTSGYHAPSSTEEKILAYIWCTVLKLDRVGIKDNFFDLGGNSILAIEMLGLAKEYKLFFSPRHLFQFPTIQELLSHYDDTQGSELKTETELLSEVLLDDSIQIQNTAVIEIQGAMSTSED